MDKLKLKFLGFKISISLMRSWDGKMFSLFDAGPIVGIWDYTVS